MKILLVCAAFPPHGKGGGPVASTKIADGLAMRGHQVRVVTVADGETNEKRSGFEVRTISSPNVYWNYWVDNPRWKKILWHALENGNPRAFLQMRREIRHYPPDVLVTVSIENINVATWLAARLEGIPVVHMLQSYFLMCWRGGLFKNGYNCSSPCFDCRALSIGKKRLSQYVEGVTGESRYIVDRHLQAGYFGSAISCVVPGAVETPAAASRCDPFEHNLRVGFIGFHGAHKGIDTLANAAIQIQNNKGVEFLIAGDGDPEYTELIKNMFPVKITEYLGWVRREEFYPSVHVVVVPSVWQEPFGHVSIEALSYGIPVIAARSGGLPETITDGKSGLTFEAGNAEELARLISLLAEDRRLLARLGTGAAREAARFGLDSVAEQMEMFLLEVLQRRGQTPVTVPGLRNSVRDGVGVA